MSRKTRTPEAGETYLERYRRSGYPAKRRLRVLRIERSHRDWTGNNKSTFSYEIETPDGWVKGSRHMSVETLQKHWRREQ